MHYREYVRFDPFGPRLQLFTGKGGVGKTTVVAALAKRAAAHGMRPLVVEMGHRASMETVLGGGPIGYEPKAIDGVWAMNLDQDLSLTDYIATHLRARRLAAAILKNAVVQRFAYAAPAVQEVAVLSKLSELATSDSFHPIYVDLDATGHAVMLLDLPRVLDSLLGKGPLRRLLAGVSQVLSDPETTALHLVTLPAELPAQETTELYRLLLERRPAAMGSLIVNRTPSPAPGLRAGPALDTLEARCTESNRTDFLESIHAGRRQLDEVKRARRVVTELVRRVPLPVVEIADHQGAHSELSLLDSVGQCAEGCGHP